MVLFHTVVSNPPYQLAWGNTAAKSIYPNFMWLGLRLGYYSTMIHPVRAFTVKVRGDNGVIQSLQEEPRLGSTQYFPDATRVFPHTEISGGVGISAYSKDGSIPVTDLSNILPPSLQLLKEKIMGQEFTSLRDSIHLYSNNRLRVHNGVTQLRSNVFFKYPSLFSYKETSSNDVKILGREKGKRVFKFVKKENILIDPWWLKGYLVVIPAAHGGGFGQIGKTQILDSGVIVTQTFLGLARFNSYEEAVNFEKYVNTSFVRALLGLKKFTQHNNRETWEYVPLLDDYSNANPVFNESGLSYRVAELFGVTTSELQNIEKLMVA